MSKCQIGKYSAPDGSHCALCLALSVTLGTSSQSMEYCVCQVGAYGRGSNCSACANYPGISCSRPNMTIPDILAGYFRNPNDNNSALVCIPAIACPGSFDGETTCTEGYTGFLCGDCVTGKFYKQGVLCSKCPSK